MQRTCAALICATAALAQPGVPHASLVASSQAGSVLTTTRPAATEGVTVEVAPVQVSTRTFNRRNPPSDMPTLRPGEAAVTKSEFACRTNTTAYVDPSSVQRNSAGQYVASVTVATMTVSIGLEIIIWVPEDGARKLNVHEEGHQRISEHFYATGEQVAREIAAEQIGKRYTATGNTEAEATTNAIREASNLVAQRYMAQVQVPSATVQETYDDITDHGRNRVDEDKAIQRAIEEQLKQQANSPATVPSRSS